MFSIHRTGALALVTLLASACMPKANLRVLQPASVDVPADIQVIGVIDRSSPNNAGQQVLGSLEALVTGETVGADRQGRAAALDAAIRVLEESPRFTVVRPTIGRAARGGLWDQELDFATVRRICERAGCDALLSLDAFDSDSQLQVNGVSVASLSNPTRLARQVAHLDPSDISADSRTSVTASWRLYDADQRVVVDELRDHARTYRWQDSGSLVDVQRALPLAGASVANAGTSAGAAYAARISPSWQWLERRYYASGDPRLRSAKRYVKAGDWEGAMRVWQGMMDSASPRARAKASFNLALAFEAQGDFGKALASAREAAVGLHNGKARDYVFVLEQREREEARLARQMTPAAEPTRVADAGSPNSARRQRPTRPSRSGAAPAGRRTRPTQGGMNRPR